MCCLSDESQCPARIWNITMSSPHSKSCQELQLHPSAAAYCAPCTQKRRSLRPDDPRASKLCLHQQLNRMSHKSTGDRGLSATSLQSYLVYHKEPHCLIMVHSTIWNSGLQIMRVMAPLLSLPFCGLYATVISFWLNITRLFVFSANTMHILIIHRFLCMFSHVNMH